MIFKPSIYLYIETLMAFLNKYNLYTNNQDKNNVGRIK